MRSARSANSGCADTIHALVWGYETSDLILAVDVLPHLPLFKSGSLCRSPAVFSQLILK